VPPFEPGPRFARPGDGANSTAFAITSALSEPSLFANSVLTVNVTLTNVGGPENLSVSSCRDVQPLFTLIGPNGSVVDVDPPAIGRVVSMGPACFESYKVVPDQGFFRSAWKWNGLVYENSGWGGVTNLVPAPPGNYTLVADYRLETTNGEPLNDSDFISFDVFPGAIVPPLTLGGGIENPTLHPGGEMRGVFEATDHAGPLDATGGCFLPWGFQIFDLHGREFSSIPGWPPCYNPANGSMQSGSALSQAWHWDGYEHNWNDPPGERPVPPGQYNLFVTFNALSAGRPITAGRNFSLTVTG
jgi:hypothetical protein